MKLMGSEEELHLQLTGVRSSLLLGDKGSAKAPGGGERVAEVEQACQSMFGTAHARGPKNL